MPRKQSDLPGDYAGLLTGLKGRIAAARLKAALAVNSELILLYWQIGHDIRQRQRVEGWGAKIVDRLAADLRRAFPEMTGLSARNLKYMRAFAEAYPNSEFVQQVAAQLPWGHAMVLLDTVKKPGSVNGTCGKPSKTAGAATSSSTRSRADYTSVKAPL